MLALQWNINYRFYDNNTGLEKQVKISTFNSVHTLKERRALIGDELIATRKILDENGYNPIEDTWVILYIDREQPANKHDALSRRTPFIEALKHSVTLLKVSPGTLLKEIGPVLVDIEAAAKELRLQDMSIWSVSLKHIYQICDKAAYKRKGSFSGDKFNRQKKVLRQLYKELLLHEVVPSNLPLSLPRKKEAAKKKKEVFTSDERRKIDEHLKVNNRRFWLFIRVFFHSGARKTEMLRVKRKDVDFSNQVITYEVLKGQEYAYKERPMLDNAVELWQEACAGANNEDYVFGEDLSPSLIPAGDYVIKMRWQRMQKVLGIKKGMYQLKHTHSTEVRKKIGLKMTAELNAESEKMIEKHYDLEAEQREMDAIKSVNVPFV